MRDTWAPPAGGGWPSFDADGKRIRTDADEFCDRVIGEANEDDLQQAARGVKVLLGTTEPELAEVF